MNDDYLIQTPPSEQNKIKQNINIMEIQFKHVDGEYIYVYEMINKEDNPHYLQTVTLYEKKSDTEVGHFKVDGFSGNGNESPYKSGRTMEMTIFLEPEHTRKGLSKKMMKYLFECSEKIFGPIPNDHNIYIDADASDWFWNKIGMKENRYYTSQRDLEGAGYEKVISYGELKKWLHKNKKGSRKSKRKGKRKRKGKGTRKKKRKY